MLVVSRQFISDVEQAVDAVSPVPRGAAAGSCPCCPAGPGRPGRLCWRRGDVQQETHEVDAAQ